MNLRDANLAVRLSDQGVQRAQGEWLGRLIAWSGIACIFLTCGCFRGSESSPEKDSTTSKLSSESEALLARVKEALASTENLETEAAVEQWQELRRELPDDPAVALNLALASVLHVDALTAKATDSVQSAEERKQTRKRLPAALRVAREAIQDYKSNSGESIVSVWLASRIGVHEATLLGKSMGKSLREELFGELASAIATPDAEQSRAVMLGGPIVELLEKMTDPVDGLPERLAQQATQTLVRLSNTHPQNLFLATKALALAIENESPDASKLVERSWSLAKAVEPTLAVFTKPIGVTPKELTERIVDAINDDNWATAQQSFILWSNVLNPLEIVRTDRRQASPHPLDRLNFETVRQLSASLAKENPIAVNAKGLPSFEPEFVAVESDHLLTLDADLDMRPDLVVAAPSGLIQLMQSASDQTDESWTVTAQLQANGSLNGLLAADLFMVDSSDSDRLKASSKSKDSSRDFSGKARHNSIPSLVAYGTNGVQLIQVDVEKTAGPDVLSFVGETSGLEDLKNVISMIAGDLEGDGDLDLVSSTDDGSLRVFINRGNRTFFEVGVGAVSVDSGDPVAAMAIGDLDRDIDLDIVTLHQSGKIGILENLLHLQFHHRYLEEIPALPVEADDDTLMIAMEDVDSNVGWDLLASCKKQSLIAFANSSDIGVWNVDRVETGAGFANRPVLADLDNDSFFEWVGAGDAVRVGPWGISVIESELAIEASIRDLAVVDLRGNGALDLIGLQPEGVQVHRNPLSTSDAHQMTVRFKGIADNAAASGRVNHYAIGSVLELRFGPYYRSRIVSGPSTHFGMAGFRQADSIRVIMPNGLTQVIRKPPVDSLVEEEQTLKGSCPYLYAWNGERFEFVTDCLWAAPLGLQVAAGVVQKDRPWEYLKIDGRFVAPRDDGTYELRLTEELWEVAYVDHVELIAVDHPREVSIFTNEKVGPPPIAMPTVYAFPDDATLEPVAAMDQFERDVLGLLRENDEQYVQGFDRRIRQGLCEPHWIDLTFGQDAEGALWESETGSPGSSKTYLVLRGWILPTDTSLNIQIDQNPELPAIEFPSVWVPDTQDPSKWTRAIEFMGFPGGKTKTIVVDVSEHANRKDLRFRVRTSAQIYWDSASLVVQKGESEVVQQTAPLVSASVEFHGFSARSKASPSSPETYDYNNALADPKWPPLHGELT
ncbi:MAG: FG-GAP-like repeat-containing protein, partial [Planctomycetota bacterium]